MFAQTIRGKASNPEAVRAALDAWLRDLRPGADGWVNLAGGVSEDGEYFGLVCFEDETKAKANSDRPEQDAWWREFSTALDGPATFENTTDVSIQQSGDLFSAGFVQVMIGQTSDVQRSRELGEQSEAALHNFRPDVLGMITATQPDGRYTTVAFFTSEAEARVGEKKEVPEELKPLMDEMMSLSDGIPEFIDLKDPILHSAG
jgi:hypothetical protein